MVPDGFLVAYDYGQGAVWAYVRAESADDITKRFPELNVVSEAPAWLTQPEAERLPRLDIDQPSGLLADILRNR